VCELGPDVTDLAVGQPVCAFVDEGGYAQQAIADARLTFTIPDGSDAGLMMAACIPTVGITAWSVLHRAARLSAGETVLVHAAAGGLGTLLGQLARELGAARVIGTVGSPAKVAYARAFGYHDVLLRERFAADLAGIDVIVDSIGGAVRKQSLDLLKPYGRLVVCGNATAEPDFRAGAGDLMSRNAAVVGYSIGWLATRAPIQVRDAGLEVLQLLHSGAARIDITEVIELDHIRDAHERLEHGRTQGKLVMRIDGSA
jgi:NADPH2:quinone reductase